MRTQKLTRLMNWCLPSLVIAILSLHTTITFAADDAVSRTGVRVPPANDAKSPNKTDSDNANEVFYGPGNTSDVGK